MRQELEEEKAELEQKVEDQLKAGEETVSGRAAILNLRFLTRELELGESKR